MDRERYIVPEPPPSGVPRGSAPPGAARRQPRAAAPPNPAVVADRVAARRFVALRVAAHEGEQAGLLVGVGRDGDAGAVVAAGPHRLVDRGVDGLDADDLAVDLVGVEHLV